MGGSSDGVGVEGSLCYASDSEGYCATLKTKPDFGCNQFEAKE
jgi:hypothetical protein